MGQLCLEDTLALLELYNNYTEKLRVFYEDKKVQHRGLNFPEDISENIVTHLICLCENKDCLRNKAGGDLVIFENDTTIKVEVKCFTSTGPSSFGPNESWHLLYFLDARDFMNGNFKLYKVELSNENERFRSIPVNKKQTYGDQCKEKRRPRISFERMHKYISEDTTVVFDGNIFELHTNNTINLLDALDALTL